jgi:DNA modification methylase
MWASRKNIWDASASPSGIKRGWYICMYYVWSKINRISAITYQLSRLQYSSYLSHGKMWASRKNIWDASASPSGIKRGWYICMYYVWSKINRLSAITYQLSRLQYSSYLSHGKMWASRKNIWDASATPSGIKRGWYVCISAIVNKTWPSYLYYHHQHINVPTAGVQALLMDYT